MAKKKRPRYANLAEYLEGEGVSHGAFARRINVTQSYITQLIRDPTRQPALNIAIRIATAAKIPITSLVREKAPAALRPPPRVLE